MKGGIELIEELRAERDKAAAEAELLSVALAGLKEQCTSTDAEWQQHLMPLHEGYTGDGCESGDPRDWTYSAIRQRMNAYENEIDELRQALRPFVENKEVTAAEHINLLGAARAALAKP